MPELLSIAYQQLDIDGAIERAEERARESTYMRQNGQHKRDTLKALQSAMQQGMASSPVEVTEVAHGGTLAKYRSTQVKRGAEDNVGDKIV